MAITAPSDLRSRTCSGATYMMMKRCALRWEGAPEEGAQEGI